MRVHVTLRKSTISKVFSLENFLKQHFKIMQSAMKKKIIKYVYSEYLIEQSDKNPAVPKRAQMVHELISCYGLLHFMDIIVPKICRLADLRWFHSSDYLEFINQRSVSDESDSDADDDSDFGLGFDCPTWTGIFDYISCIGGATMTACDALCKGLADIVINWNGGWHHAHRDKAGGYCYVNDIVLGILVLRKKYNRIFYLDLDVHHGDGVQEAFETTKRVFTLSFHQYEAGFFPGSGSHEDCGIAAGKGYAANFPFKSGIAGELFVKYFKRITNRVLSAYQPQVCVIQCGGDVIAGDPLGSSNLYPEDLIECIQSVVQMNLPMVLLGGGGYNFQNTSRYWTQITAAVCKQALFDDIPDKNEFFLDYGPDYTLQVAKRRMADSNSAEYLEYCASVIEKNLEKYNVTCV